MNIEQELKKFNISKKNINDIFIITKYDIQNIFAFPLEYLKEIYLSRYYIKELLKILQNVDKKLDETNNLLDDLSQKIK